MHASAFFLCYKTRVSDPAFVTSTRRNPRVCDPYVFILTFSSFFIYNIGYRVRWLSRLQSLGFPGVSWSFRRVFSLSFWSFCFVILTNIILFYLHTCMYHAITWRPLNITSQAYVSWYLFLVMTWLITCHLPDHLSLAGWDLIPVMNNSLLMIITLRECRIDLLLWTPVMPVMYSCYDQLRSYSFP